MRLFNFLLLAQPCVNTVEYPTHQEQPHTLVINIYNYIFCIHTIIKITSPCKKVHRINLYIDLGRVSPYLITTGTKNLLKNVSAEEWKLIHQSDKDNVWGKPYFS